MSYEDGIRKEHNDIARLLESRYEQLVMARKDVASLREALNTAMRWRSAALRIGEELASDGPPGYTAMLPDQWRNWALERLQGLGQTVGEMLDATSPAKEGSQQAPPDAAPIKGEGEHPRDRYRCCHCGEPPSAHPTGKQIGLICHGVFPSWP